jgi:hypothetical protein
MHSATPPNAGWSGDSHLDDVVRKLEWYFSGANATVNGKTNTMSSSSGGSGSISGVEKEKKKKRKRNEQRGNSDVKAMARGEDQEAFIRVVMRTLLMADKVEEISDGLAQGGEQDVRRAKRDVRRAKRDVLWLCYDINASTAALRNKQQQQMSTLLLTSPPSPVPFSLSPPQTQNTQMMENKEVRMNRVRNLLGAILNMLDHSRQGDSLAILKCLKSLRGIERGVEVAQRLSCVDDRKKEAYMRYIKGQGADALADIDGFGGEGFEERAGRQAITRRAKFGEATGVVIERGSDVFSIDDVLVVVPQGKGDVKLARNVKNKGTRVGRVTGGGTLAVATT